MFESLRQLYKWQSMQTEIPPKNSKSSGVLKHQLLEVSSPEVFITLIGRQGNIKLNSVSILAEKQRI